MNKSNLVKKAEKIERRSLYLAKKIMTDAEGAGTGERKVERKYFLIETLR